jgi:hypothetical protein
VIIICLKNLSISFEVLKTGLLFPLPFQSSGGPPSGIGAPVPTTPELSSLNNNQDYDGIDKSKGEDLVFTVPTITAACAANPACASATAAGIVYVGSKIAEPVAEAVSAVGDAIADGVVIAVDAVQDALNKTTEDESEDNSGVVGTGAPMPDGEPPVLIVYQF